MSKYAGFVAKIGCKEGRGKRGAWYTYSFKVEKEDGNEYDQWFGFGFNKEPPFKEGDYIIFEAEEKDGFFNYVEGTGAIPKNPPARKQAKASSQRANGMPSGSGNKDNVSSQPSGADRQTQIVMQHSQEMALALVDILLRNDALPVSSAKTKSGEAKRYEEITAFVNKETVRLYNDVVTGRLLETVADSGIVDVKPDAALPETTTEGNDGEDDSDPNSF